VSGRSVLIVDDDPQIVGYLERVLQKAGYQTFSASDGAQALRTLDKQTVDCILTDIVMPKGIGGAELFIALRQSTPDLPIVVMSGNVSLDTEAFRRLAAQFGVRQILHKPFDPEELLAAIEQALGADKA